jgi:hypothetical protein
MREGTNIERARAAKSVALARLGGLAEVNGVGITRVGEGFGVKVNLAAQPDPGTEFPEEIDGVPLVTELVGRISKREL